jgi:hypothetical protein
METVGKIDQVVGYVKQAGEKATDAAPSTRRGTPSGDEAR